MIYNVYRLRKDPALGDLSGKVIQVLHVENDGSLIVTRCKFDWASTGIPVPLSWMTHAKHLNKSRMAVKDNVQHWYLVGTYGNLLHRVDGPALISDTETYWYINGNEYDSSESYQAASGMTDDDMLVMILKYGPVQSSWVTYA